MAKTVLSLEEMKAELRINADVTEHDALITGQIAAAVSFVSKEISTPLIDVTETYYAEPYGPAGADQLLCFPPRDVRSVPSIKYWTADGALRSEPDGEIAEDGHGRVVATAHGTAVYPPETGWPERLPGSLFAVEAVRGMDVARATFDDQGDLVTAGKGEGLIQAVILVVRQLYDGYREIRPTEAFYALIAPWRYYGV